jgi:Mesyanzhinovviridae bifunctional DNA primase/polymerase
MSYLRTIPNGEPPKPSFELLKPHLEGGHDLIPLKPLSNDPTHFDWPSMAPLSADEARAHMAAGGNIGIRLRPDMLVIDVNLYDMYEGKSPIQWLEIDMGVRLTRGPLVLTGSRHQQFYFRKPASAKIRSGLFRGPAGLSFHSSIEHVLASGSVDPRTHEHYRCEILQDVFADAPEIPIALLNRMARQEGGYVPTTARRLSSVSAALKGLGPMSSDELDLFGRMFWFHFDTGGAGREAFVEWAISHANYAGHRERVEALWSSLKGNTVERYSDWSRMRKRGPRPGC